MNLKEEKEAKKKLAARRWSEKAKKKKCVSMNSFDAPPPPHTDPTDRETHSSHYTPAFTRTHTIECASRVSIFFFFSYERASAVYRHYTLHSSSSSRSKAEAADSGLNDIYSMLYSYTYFLSFTMLVRANVLLLSLLLHLLCCAVDIGYDTIVFVHGARNRVKTIACLQNLPIYNFTCNYHN